MKQTRNYGMRQIGHSIIAVIYTLAVVGDLGLVFTTSSIAMKIGFSFLVIFLLKCSIGEWLRVYILGREWRLALFCKLYGEPVAADHGATIPEVMANLRGEGVEYAAAFTKDGKKLCESTMNRPDMTLLSDADRELVLKNPEGTLVHNHPGDEPIAFSPEDLVSLATGTYNRAIVVTPSVAYVMEVPERSCLPPHLIHWLGRRFYRGRSNTEASFNFCMAVAKHLDWKFGIMLPRPEELADGAATEALCILAVDGRFLVAGMSRAQDNATK